MIVKDAHERSMRAMARIKWRLYHSLIEHAAQVHARYSRLVAAAKIVEQEAKELEARADALNNEEEPKEGERVP